MEMRCRRSSDYRITEVFDQNLAYSITESTVKKENGPLESLSRPMEGDIPASALRYEFVMGVRIGWPFLAMLKPQTLMAVHIIKGLKTRKHVVLESPTGTGKSAAILCSVLAWQRFHYKTTGEKVKVIYCSRTHSQVEQMVASLQKTPYRPNMTVLGSRDRMCIHQHVDRKNINDECRTRIKNTDHLRKSIILTTDEFYDDDNPLTALESDEIKSAESQQRVTSSSDSMVIRKKIRPTCPHYRQLTAPRTADNAVKSFRSPPCISSDSDDSTKAGTHDIEDLVQFGKNPYKRTVVLKKCTNETWGLMLSRQSGSSYPHVEEILKGGRVARCGSIQVNDQVFRINQSFTAGRPLDEVNNEMELSKEKVVLEIGTNNDEFSEHSSCPYYISRGLENYAELVFCPYNYVLDLEIRKSLRLRLENTVVVLDEAHNVEDTLRNAGSGTWSEIDLCSMIAALQSFSKLFENKYATNPRTWQNSGVEEGLTTDVMAHALLLFLETVILFMRDKKQDFETNGEAAKAISDWRRFHTPNNQSFELSYDGPNGHGLCNTSGGCKGFFERLNMDAARASTLREYAAAMKKHGQEIDDFRRTKIEAIYDVVSKLTLALEQPEHFYVQTTVQVNGSFEFAAGELVQQRRLGHSQTAKPLPYAHGRNSKKPNVLVNACRHCRNVKEGHDLVFIDDRIRHGSYIDGSTPAWQTFLTLELLTPQLFMQHLTRECRSVILASGSLAPLPSLCSELGLSACSSSEKTIAESSPTTSLPTTSSPPTLPPTTTSTPITASIRTTTSTPTRTSNETIVSTPTTLSTPERYVPSVTNLLNLFKGCSITDDLGRLQVQPPPLEADHVICLEKQLLAVAIGHFRNGEKLSVTYNNYKEDTFIVKLGDAIATIIESIPRGGVLVFLPSYTLLTRCMRIWEKSSALEPNHAATETIWDRLLNSKGKIIIEPTGSQAEFEAARDEYLETIRRTGNCILFAVFRGKMSEGISFNDDNARGVICVGIPYPSAKDRSIIAKKSYNDEQRKFGNRSDLLPGVSWYNQQAYRAIAQALGRCIRHAGDYGTVILLDTRHCDESPPDAAGVCMAHRQLPKWMRSHVKTLTMRTLPPTELSSAVETKWIGGGWPGLRANMKSFFDEAPSFAAEVLRKQDEDQFEAQRRRIQDNLVSPSFNRRSGQWTISPDRDADRQRTVPATPTSVVQEVQEASTKVLDRPAVVTSS